jgi:hypothetical protein
MTAWMLSTIKAVVQLIKEATPNIAKPNQAAILLEFSPLATGRRGSSTLEATIKQQRVKA